MLPLRFHAPALLFALILLARPDHVLARDVPVTTTAALTMAIAAAQSGDVILLADGVYPIGNIDCSAVGTSGSPIVVRAQSHLGAFIQVSGAEGFRVSGAHWRFEDLDVHGVCSADSNCEHAFHVSGAADGFQLRNSRVRDFNAQLKVNAAMVGGVMTVPDGGLIEGNELADTHARTTSNPVTKLNIDSGDDWVLRENFIHDHHKAGGDNVSYGAFLKSGGKRGVMERNLVQCSRDDLSGGTRIGLSLGGGGTAPQFCAPAFSGTECPIEHDGGILRNNVIVECSDVGIYLNKAANSKILHNTLIATAGIDFRYQATSGEAAGNVIAGALRMRDQATFTQGTNLTGVSPAMFAAFYQAPLRVDLRARDVSMLLGRVPARGDVPDDWCGRARGTGMISLGAIEHMLGDCVARWPGDGEGTGAGDGGAGNTRDAGGDGGGDPDGSVRQDAGGDSDADGSVAGDAGGDSDADGSVAGDAGKDGGGCGCRAGRASGADPVMLLGLLAALLLRVRRR